MPGSSDDFFYRQLCRAGGRGFAFFMHHPFVKLRLQLAAQLHVCHSLALFSSPRGAVLPAALRKALKRKNLKSHKKGRSKQRTGHDGKPELGHSATFQPVDLARMLCSAALVGNLEQVQQLLALKANVTHQVPTGATALALASGQGHVEVVRELLQAGSDTYQVDGGGVSPLMRAARRGHDIVVKVLLKEGKADPMMAASDGRTALMEAARGGHTGAMRLLLEELQRCGAELDGGNEVNGDHPLLDAVASGSLAAVQLMVDMGARINRINNEGTSALLLAAGHGHLDIVRFLLSKRAKQLPEYCANQTPLIAAAISGHDQVVAELLAAGADASIKDANGLTAADQATSPRVLAVLQQYAAAAAIKPEGGKKRAAKA